MTVVTLNDELRHAEHQIVDLLHHEFLHEDCFEKIKRNRLSLEALEVVQTVLTQPSQIILREPKFLLITGREEDK